MNTTSDRIILRLSPNYASDYTIYATEAGGDLMAVSHNRGNSWKRRLAPGAVIDIVVEDEDTLYAALPRGYIRKSTNSAFTWGEPVPTGLSDINMLAIAGKGHILVGSRNGEAAYSTDGGVSFTRIDEVIGNGDVQIVADTNYQENGVIYAATDAPDQGIWRWVIGLSTSWEQIDESITTLETGQRISGLAMGSEGTLYALRLEPAGDSSGGMTRSLNPSNLDTTEIEFDFINDALPEGTAFDPTAVFANTLPHLKLSGDSGQNELWAIDTASEIIYRFQDTLATVAAKLVAPKQDFVVKMNPITGRAVMVNFIWERPSENVEDYDLWIAFDQGLNEVVKKISISDTGSPINALVGPGGAYGLEWNFGTVYFWRVRVSGNGPVRSPWSEVRRFTIAEAEVQPPVQVEITPSPPAPEITLTVPPAPTITIPSPPAPSAPIAPAWIWAVVIISVLLVVALIVLIVRTGR
jgi:hypothetical protein